MRTGSQLAARIEGASVSVVEAALLKDRVGDVFDAYVIDVRENDPTAGTVHLCDPAVVARVRGGSVRLAEADVERHTLLFAPA